MLRLHSTTSKTFNHLSARFDQVTKKGVIASAENFELKDGKATVNGKTISLPYDWEFAYMSELALLDYLKKLTEESQLDMFADKPFKQVNFPRYDHPKPLLKAMPWEHMDCNWRATDVSGSGAYFKHRPRLDKAGFWVVCEDNRQEMPLYGSGDYHTGDYHLSLQNIGAVT